MKKMIALFLSVALAACCFAGCSEKDAAKSTEASTPSNMETSAPVEYFVSAQTFLDNVDGRYMVVTSADAEGNVAWTYTTAVCDAKGHDNNVQYLGRNGDTLYINEQGIRAEGKERLFTGYLTALDANTGAIKWQSVEFTGSNAACVFDEKGNIYLCSEDGLDCAAFNEYGLRMWVIEDVSESSSNAKSIEMVDGELVVSFAVYDDNAFAKTHIGLDGTIK